jgi:hypothetical protein
MVRGVLTGLLLAGLLVAPSGAAPPKRCVAAEEASADARAAGEDAPARFTAAFYRRVFTLDTSLDGIDGDGEELPISIEELCEVPKRLAKQAAQLAGSDGVALLLPRTTIWEGDVQLTGDDAATALDGADTAFLRARLLAQRSWHADEDGDPIPTFRTGRIEITD